MQFQLSKPLDVPKCSPFYISRFNRRRRRSSSISTQLKKTALTVSATSDLDQHSDSSQLFEVEFIICFSFWLLELNMFRLTWVFKQKLKDAETQRIEKLEELDRKANVQLERQLVLASSWSRALLTTFGKLKGTQWDPLNSHPINFSDFNQLLESNDVQFMEYSNYGQSLSGMYIMFNDSQSFRLDISFDSSIEIGVVSILLFLQSFCLTMMRIRGRKKLFIGAMWWNVCPLIVGMMCGENSTNKL